ncbi:ABC transporter substrate-binding protein [soil metagenome]
MPRASALLAGGCVAALLLSACSQASPSGAPSSGGGEPSGAPKASSSPVFRAHSKVLTVAINPPSSLDPMRIADPGSLLIARQLFEGLTSWDQTKEEAVPAAAKSWDVSKGGRVFTFKLRPGMTFHNGEPVTAQDFEFAFDRIARKRSASDIAYALADVKGFAAVNRRGASRTLAGIRAPDKRTLVIELKHPDMNLPAVLTHPGLVPLLRNQVARSRRWLSHPVGNGPFRLVGKWSPHGHPVLLAADPRSGTRPQLDGLRFLPFSNPAQAWRSFVQGGVDVTEVPTSEIKAARESYGNGAFSPLLAGYYYGFDVSTVDDVRVRRAINRAIDRSAIRERALGGILAPPRGIVPRGMPGFSDDVCKSLCDYSPRAARRLLRPVPSEAKAVTITYTKEAPHGRVAHRVAKDLEAVGLKVRLRGLPLTEFLRRLTSGPPAFFRLGWLAEYPSPDVFLSDLFGSDAPDNHFDFARRGVDNLLSTARRTRDASERLALYRRAERAVLATVPVVPIGSYLSHWAAKPPVKGLQLDVMGGFDAVGVSLGNG